MRTFIKVFGILICILILIGVITSDSGETNVVLPFFIFFLIAYFIITKNKNKKSSKQVPISKLTGQTANIKKYYNSYKEGIQTFQRMYNIDEMPDRFIMVDLETTGLSNYRDRIIEIAMIKYENGNVVETLHQLIDPEISIPVSVTNINGITNEMVQDQPKIYEVIDKIYNFINGEIIAGYNVEFDLHFLSTALGRSNLHIDNVIILDVMQLVKETIPKREVPNYKLSTIKNYFNIQNKSHRALADCETAFQVLSKCLKIKENLRVQAEAEQMERLSKLNDAEKAFIAALEKQLESINQKEMLNYNIMGDRTINFKIKSMQIGRVKLRGKQYKMQILNKDNAIWFDIDNVDEAINNIKHWIKYCKYLAS